MGGFTVSSYFEYKGNEVNIFSGSGTVYIYSLSGKSDVFYKKLIEHLKGNKHIIALTSEEDNAYYDLRAAGFKELYAYGNNQTDHEIKVMVYEY